MKALCTFLNPSSVDFDQRYSAYPTPTYPSDSVSVAKNSKDVTGKTKSARNFIHTLMQGWPNVAHCAKFGALHV